MIGEVLTAAAFLVALPAAMLGLVRVLDGGPGSGHGLHRWLTGWRVWHLVAAMVLTALIFSVASAHSPFPILLAALVILALFLRAWRQEVLFLMSLRDDDFPGRYDKLIWIVMLTTFVPIGLWFFRSYREAHWPEPEPVKGTPAGELA